MGDPFVLRTPFPDRGSGTRGETGLCGRHRPHSLPEKAGALACEGYDGFGWCLAMYPPLVESLPGPPTEGNHDRLTAVLLAKR